MRASVLPRASPNAARAPFARADARLQSARSRRPVRSARARAVASDAPAQPSSGRLKSFATLPNVPAERVRWVDDVEGLRAATEAVRALGGSGKASTSARAPPCIGLDA